MSDARLSSLDLLSARTIVPFNPDWAKHHEHNRKDVQCERSRAIALSHPPSIIPRLIARDQAKEHSDMATITTKDGVEIFYKDWGSKEAQAIVFHHGWPLSADDWDNQMMFFLGKGYRVIAHDRRGHGRSTQTDTGNDMDTYVEDVKALARELDLRGAIHIGHSTGGGEVTRYVARAEPGRVAKAVLISAITPVMVKSDSNPVGTPIEAFDAYRAGVAGNRAQIYLDIA